MKSKEVIKTLKISRQTLTKYVKDGRVSVTKLPNGFYDYNDDDVLRLANVNEKCTSVIYARVSTQKQKTDLASQIETIRRFANENGYTVDKVYQDIASGLQYDRGEFEALVDDVISRRVKRVFISNKDRLTRISFDFWKRLFARHNCELIVANNDTCQSDSEEKEIFQDIIALLSCYTTRRFSSRRMKKIALIKEDLENEIGL